MQSNSLMQSQDMLQKSFFDQLRPGDFIDVKNTQGNWKLAKVIDKDNKYLSVIFDGYALDNEQVYINPMRVRPLRMITAGYTGPFKNNSTTLTPIPELKNQLSVVQTLINAQQPPSAFKATQYLRGQLFTSINSLLMSDLDFSQSEIQDIYQFFMRFIQKIHKICELAQQYGKDYLEANLSNKLIYLASYKVSIVFSLQQILTLLSSLIQSGAQMPRLLKRYKNTIQIQNLVSHAKPLLKVLYELLNLNDGNGKWLPTSIRLKIIKIFIRYKKENEVQAVKYQWKDYLQFYTIWPSIMQMMPDKQNQQKLLKFILIIITKPTPFDAKLKSLQTLRKIMQKQIKFVHTPVSTVSQILIKKNILGCLLQSFNPQIFKRYIPILSIICEHSKKTLTQNHIDQLFHYLKNRHESEVAIIYEIMVSISQFINTSILDYIYADIEKNNEQLLSSEHGIQFIRNFTIKAIINFNSTKNKGIFSSLIGKKKASSKYSYYGLNLFWKEIQDSIGHVRASYLIFVINNMGTIFKNQCFHHIRQEYMYMCLQEIEKRNSYGQCIKLLQQIVNTYPITAYISDYQQSVIWKLDEKYKVLNILIKPLKDLEKIENSESQKSLHKNAIKQMKVPFNQSVKYFYEFMQRFGQFLKYKISIQNIMSLWNTPYIFDYLRKSRSFNETQIEQIPLWKRKYYKKLDKQVIRDMFMRTLSRDQYVTMTMKSFQAIDQLFLSYNIQIKVLQMTQRTTIRYHNLENMMGIDYYYRLLNKLLDARIRLRKLKKKKKAEKDDEVKKTLKRQDQSKDTAQSSMQKNQQLLKKVIPRIIQIYIRPYYYQKVEVQYKSWMVCLMKLLNSTKSDAEVCVFTLQKFFTLIKGRLSKEINVSGKIDILVSYQSRNKTISLPRNSTILKLREGIMQAYGLKTNFALYNVAMKRQIKHFEEQDFSVNAMSYAHKGPSIFVRRVQNTLYPQHEAQEIFMGQIKFKQQFYKILFKLLEQQSSLAEQEKMNLEALQIETKIWNLLDSLPINEKIIKIIQNNQDVTQKDWQLFLMPNKIQQLQYRINIVYQFMKGDTNSLINGSNVINNINNGNALYQSSSIYSSKNIVSTTTDDHDNKKWIANFIKNGGVAVVQELYLSMLAANIHLRQKIVMKLSKIILKIYEYQSSEKLVSKSDKNQGQQNETKEDPKNKTNINYENLENISKKIMQIIDDYITKQKQNQALVIKNKKVQSSKSEHSQQKMQQKQNSKEHSLTYGPKAYISIQSLNLLTKFLLLSSHKHKIPSQSNLLKYFIQENRLLQLANTLLFKPKDQDSSFFTQQILQKIILNLSKNQQSKIDIFHKLIFNHLDLCKLKQQKESVHNYFMFLVDFVHSKDNNQKDSDIFNENINQIISKFIEEAVNTDLLLEAEDKKCRFSQNQNNKETMSYSNDVQQKYTVVYILKDIEEQILNGALKLINLSLNNQNILKNPQKIFKCLINDFIFNDSNLKLKLKQKNKKLLFDIVKKLIYKSNKLCQYFISKIQPKLQVGEWRSSMFTFWNLQQQKRQKKYFCGLENLGATCYINCLFQQLFMIDKFRDRFINVDSLSYRQSIENNQIYQLQKLLTYLKYGNKRSYSTKSFCESFITYEGLPIDPMIQNDADEFFNTLMDKIESFLKLAQQHKILEDTFEGKLSNQLNGEECSHNSEKIQPFSSIGVNIKNKKTLEQALEGYVQGQTLEGDNAYFCQICQKKVKVTKRLCIKQLPNILVIVLKRFTFNFDQMRKIKINDECKYPQEINMKKYMSEYLLNQTQLIKQDEEYMYKLRGVVIHSGTSQGGHYYSFIKNCSGDKGKNKWYEFNDDIIEQAEYKRIEEEGFGGEEKNSEIKMQKYKNAYVLFYEKEKQKIIDDQAMIQSKQLSKMTEQQTVDNNKQSQTQIQFFNNKTFVGTNQFEHQLSELVISQNNSADFLAILLDPLFIRLCQSITMSGYKNVSEFIILYFHTILIRDKNKDQYLGNVYRIVLVLLEGKFEDQNKKSQKIGQRAKINKDGQDENKEGQTQEQQNLEQNKQQKQQQNEQANKQKSMTQQSQNKQPEKNLALWFINQISQSYITQFLIQAPRVPRYLCTGLILHCLKLLVSKNIQIPENFIKCLVFSINLKKKGLNPLGKIFTYLSSIQKYKVILISLNFLQLLTHILLPKEKPKTSIFEFENNSQSSYFDNSAASKNTYQKQLEPVNSTLVKSLKYYKDQIISSEQTACSLTKAQLIKIYEQNYNRVYCKVVAQLITYAMINDSKRLYSKDQNKVYINYNDKAHTNKQRSSGKQQAVQVPPYLLQINELVYAHKLKLKDNTIRESVQKIIFILRNLYMNAQNNIIQLSYKINSNSNTKQMKQLYLSQFKYYEQLINYVLYEYRAIMKDYENYYVVMELLICELNKMGHRMHKFKEQWRNVVKIHEDINKSCNYWLKQAYHPHFLTKNEQWVGKVYGLSYSEKEVVIEKNVRVQNRRVGWMTQEADDNQLISNLISAKSLNKQSQKEVMNKKLIRKNRYECQELHSDLEDSQVGSKISIGFKTYEVVQHLGLLTKLKSDDVNSDSKGMTRWAVLQKNDVDMIYDL